MKVILEYIIYFGTSIVYMARSLGMTVKYVKLEVAAVFTMVLAKLHSKI